MGITWHACTGSCYTVRVGLGCQRWAEDASPEYASLDSRFGVSFL